jgi:hypothetical protein
MRKALVGLLVLTLALVLPAWSGNGNSTGTITLSSGYLWFGSQSAGSVSQPKTLTVTNNSKYAFLFSGVSAETGFSVASTTCGVLHPGQSCIVQIVFVPMHAGNYVSRLNLATPYSPAAFTAVLYGSGQ